MKTLLKKGFILMLLGICLLIFASCSTDLDIPLKSKATEGLEFTLSESRTSYILTGIGTAKGTADGRFDVVIPEMYDDLPVTEIGKGVFSKCASLTSVSIPDSVTIIEDEAFLECTGLEKIILPEHLKVIGIRAFESCDNLVSISIPSEVETIGHKAFRYCGKLNNVKFSKNGKLEAIGQEVFYLCNELTSIIIPDSVKQISYETFSGCNFKEITIPFKILEDLNSACFNDHSEICIYIKDPNNELTSWDQIPSGIMQLSYTYDRGNIYVNNQNAYDVLETNTVIPGNLKVIEKRSFLSSPITSVTILNGVMSIDSLAFSYCTNLSTVIMPESLISIGYGAFQSCTSLTSITIPDGVINIGEAAFFDCNKLTSITFSDSVSNIEQLSFWGCSSLKDIYYNGTKQNWNSISFGAYWDEGTGNYTIHCTDGDIYK